MQLSNYNILLGITGGIAAYKSAYLTRLLVKAGAQVQVVMTEAGTKFVTPLTFESLTDRPVAVEMFPENRFVSTHHITLAEWPDLIIVAPATADFIAQLAQGFCQSLLAGIICATRKKVIIAPAMNEGMYANPAVQDNINTLRDRGFCISNVGVGEMACNSYGAGRMAEPDELFELVIKELKGSGPLLGKNVIVTAGPCREAIDPVRFISNRSSGKMGFALAVEAEKLGANVTLISGPATLPDPPRIRTIRVKTTAEMARAVDEMFAESDYLIMAAAPADYRPLKTESNKIKKSDKNMDIRFIPTVDILKQVASKKQDHQIVVGFSLETENEIENSQKKLRSKNLDYIVVNNPKEDGAGFEVDTNRVIIIDKSGTIEKINKNLKPTIANQIWGYILAHGRK